MLVIFSQCPFQMVTNPCISGDVYQKRESLHMCVLCVLYMQATEEDPELQCCSPIDNVCFRIFETILAL